MSLQNLGELLQQSVARYRHRPALWVDGGSISYGDLVHKALGVANAVVGLKPRTAVWANRHIWSYAGIVGSLLAGHAYVPLNPKLPLERLKSILRSADVGALVIDQTALQQAGDLLQEAPAMRIIVPDRDDLYHDMLAADIKPADGAYLLFTSGSTGEPKGVMISHRNVVSYLQTVLHRYAYSPTDRVTQMFDLTFDLSVHDMFATWAAGAALYAPSDAFRKAPYRFVPEHNLTCWFSTPATVALMARMHMLRPNAFPSLRLSLFCGEALPKRLAEQWRRAAPNSIIENLYGPTEATIALTAYRLPTDLSDLPEIIPIGWPFPDHNLFIHNEELLLSGPQVADGYWRDPARTTERFIAFEGRRAYATGDKVALSEHGYVYLGRLDRQVKIAGHRVELQEVETVLRRVAGCDMAAVLADEQDGLLRLVAVITEESRPSEAIALDCRKYLPAYMVPARFVRLRDWPLNSNGKADYRALQTRLASGEV